MIWEILSSCTLPTQRGALNKLKNHTMEVFGSIHCFSCDFLALHQYYYIICRLKYLASQHKPTNITFNQSMSLKQQEERRCWIMCYFYYLLLVPFYTVFLCHKNPCIDWSSVTNLPYLTWTQGCNTDVSFTSTVVFLVPFLVQFEHIYSCERYIVHVNQ